MISSIIVLLILKVAHSWELGSWRTKRRMQIPEYPNVNKLNEVETILKSKPPLVISSEIDDLKIK